jgi:hypothetical protein
MNIEDVLVKSCAHSELLRDFVELWHRLNNVEHRNICPGFCKTLRKGKAASPRSSSDDGCSAFEGELER